ncbi:MAG: hypothetical protein ACI808_002605 [Paraglaciecola sp.]|jgi:hypothetical protein
MLIVCSYRCRTIQFYGSELVLSDYRMAVRLTVRPKQILHQPLLKRGHTCTTQYLGLCKVDIAL